MYPWDVASDVKIRFLDVSHNVKLKSCSLEEAKHVAIVKCIICELIKEQEELNNGSC